MASMLTCYAEKRACYSLISYKTKKTQSCTDRSGTKIRTVRVRQDSCIYIGSNLFLIERETVHDIRWMSVLHRPEQSGDLERSSPAGLLHIYIGSNLFLIERETVQSGDLEPFESGRTRLYTKGILLGYLLYIRRARDGTRTRDPDLGKVVLHQLSHSRIINKIFIFKAGDGNRTHVFSLEG